MNSESPALQEINRLPFVASSLDDAHNALKG